MNHSAPGLHVHHQFPEFTQTDVLKGVIEDLKILKIKEKKKRIVKIVKIYLGLSLVVL